MSESGRIAMSDRQITITRGGEQYGPYPEANIKEMLAAGQVQPGDLAWHPGADGWKPLQELVGDESPAPPPAPPAGASEDKKEEASDPDQIHVARKGEPIGPYSRDKAKEYFIAGQLLPTDWAWHDGMGEDWKPIYEVLELPPPVQPAMAMAPAGGGNNQFPPLRWYIHVLKNYAKFGGRASRAEFWWFFLTDILIMISLGVTSVFVPFMNFLYMAYGLGTFVPGLAVGFRRLQDTGRPGIYILICLIPCVGSILLLFWLIEQGEPGSNMFGDPPRG